MKRRTTRIRPIEIDPDLASAYLRTKLAGLPPEKVDELCSVVGRRRETIDSWREGRTLPIRSVWPKISTFLGEPRSSMFDAAAIPTAEPVTR
jgi:hypothetical protein